MENPIAAQPQLPATNTKTANIIKIILAVVLLVFLGVGIYAFTRVSKNAEENTKNAYLVREKLGQPTPPSTPKSQTQEA